MSNKLTIERVEQMEKEVCIEQVKANDKYNEVFQLLGMARRDLLSLQGDVNRFAPSVETMGIEPVDDTRLVPRGLLEHCLGTFEDVMLHYGRTVARWNIKEQTDINVAIYQLKAALEIEKTSPTVCSSYHSRSWKGKCQNCGCTWERHQ